jgi:hypothetical protein
MGHTTTHSHNGLLGRGRARGPKLAAFGQPTVHVARPVRGQRMCTVRGHPGQERPTHTTRWRVIDDEVFDNSIPATPATHHNTKT